MRFLKSLTLGVLLSFICSIYVISHRVSVEYVEISVISEAENGRYLVWIGDDLEIIEDAKDWIFFKQGPIANLEPGETYNVKLAGNWISLHAKYKNIVSLTD